MECLLCNKEIEKSRRDIKYCSISCKQKAYRLRNEGVTRRNEDVTNAQHITHYELKRDGLLFIADIEAVANYFSVFSLDDYIMDFMMDMEEGDYFIPLCNKEFGDKKYKVLIHYQIKKLPNNKYELHYHG